MKLTKSFEKSLSIMTMLATQEQGVPITSDVINSKLGGSATYLKKIMRKLVVGDIIFASSGNNGGFILNRSLDEISLYDLYVAIEGDFSSYQDTGILEGIFPNVQLAHTGSVVIEDTFKKADALWIEYLKSVSLKSLLDQVIDESYPKNRDWNKDYE